MGKEIFFLHLLASAPLHTYLVLLKSLGVTNLAFGLIFKILFYKKVFKVRTYLTRKIIVY